MKTLVINSNNFIGLQYIQSLVDCNRDNHVFAASNWDNVDAALLSRINHLHHNDVSFEHELLTDLGVVIYIAPRADFSKTYDDLYEQHVIYSEKLVKLVQDTQAQHFICVSSDMLYFQTNEQYNIAEKDIPISFINDYARVMHMSEDVLHLLDQNITTTFLRPGMLYNAHINELHYHVHGNICHIYNESAQLHLTNMDLLINAILHAVDYRIGGTYNIHDITTVSIQEILPNIIIKKHHPKLLKLALWWIGLKENIARQLEKNPKKTLYDLALFNYTHTYNNELAKEKLQYYIR